MFCIDIHINHVWARLKIFNTEKSFFFCQNLDSNRRQFGRFWIQFGGNLFPIKFPKLLEIWLSIKAIKSSYKTCAFSQKKKLFCAKVCYCRISIYDYRPLMVLFLFFIFFLEFHCLSQVVFFNINICNILVIRIYRKFLLRNLENDAVSFKKSSKNV